MLRHRHIALTVLLAASFIATPALGQFDGEITPQSEEALELGLEWLAKNQGPEGNWGCNDLGLVSMGALAYMSAGHAPGRGKYGRELEKALEFVVKNAKPSGLLNIADGQRDMYNHGLATFVLGQAHGMSTSQDRRLNTGARRLALKLISSTQCEDGGWDYQAHRQTNGHDLSLAVMQAKALRSAVDSGLEVPPEVIDLAIKSVREHYSPQGNRDLPEAELKKLPGQFTYGKGGGGGTIAMAAAGVVCLQEFGQYDDWRIGKNMDVIGAAIRELTQVLASATAICRSMRTRCITSGRPCTRSAASTGRSTIRCCANYLIGSQIRDAKVPNLHGSWHDNGVRGGGRVGGREGEFYATSVGVLHFRHARIGTCPFCRKGRSKV